MRVADLGCGVGLVTRLIADLVGSQGSVVGVDVSEEQLAQARQRLEAEGVANTTFIRADATNSGLPRGGFDLVFCRFLLMHLTQPAAALREMRELLRPGGTLVCEDADLTATESIPPSAIDALAELFGRLGPIRGVDYALGRRLYHLVLEAGFPDPNIYIYRRAFANGEAKLLPELSVREATSAFIDAGIVSPAELQSTLAKMHQAAEHPYVLAVLAPVTQVWGKKPS
jgi:SAM-dependent methyltransferase